MPPKRQRSARNSAKNSAAADPAPPELEDAKPAVREANHEPEPASTPPPPTAPEDVPTITEAASPIPATPSGMSNAAQPPNSTSSAQKGKKLLSKPKFTGRRSQSRLQEIQQAEDERRRAETETKAAEEAAKARREGKRRDHGLSRGRAGSGRGRGRGGYMGERERDGEAVASGPFGAGQVSRESRRMKKPGVSSYRPLRSIRPIDSLSRVTALPAASSTTVVENGRVVKEESRPSASLRAVQDQDGDVSMDEQPRASAEDGGYISSDEDEDDKGVGRVNVEDLGVIDLTHDDPFAPVRVTRIAHREKALGINADGATDQDGVIAIDANDTTIPTEKRKGKQRAKEVEIMNEKRIFQGTYSDSESETEIKQDPEGDVESIQAPSRDTILKEPPSSPENRRKAKEKSKTRAISSDPLPEGQDYQTRDEIEEWDRHQNDLNVLQNELGAQKVEDLDGEGDATMTDLHPKDKRAEKVYLFQFPPVLPDLIPITVKPDPETANNNEEGVQVDEPVTIPDDDSKSKTRSQPNLPSGAVGKLKVHASGRVTLDWGGTSLCLGLGTEASFLQDILVVNLPDAKDEADQRGMATSMGQVKGKFVVTPDWEEILK